MLNSCVLPDFLRFVLFSGKVVILCGFQNLVLSGTLEAKEVLLLSVTGGLVKEKMFGNFKKPSL